MPARSLRTTFSQVSGFGETCAGSTLFQRQAAGLQPVVMAELTILRDETADRMRRAPARQPEGRRSIKTPRQRSGQTFSLDARHRSRGILVPELFNESDGRRLALRRVGCQKNAFGPGHRGSFLFVFDVQARAVFHQEREDVISAAIRCAEYRRQTHGVRSIDVGALFKTQLYCFQLRAQNPR